MKIYEWILESKRHTPTNDKNLAMSWLYGNRIQPCMLIESLDLENDIVIPEKLKKIINDRPTIEADEMSEWLDQELDEEKTFAFGMKQKVYCALISNEFYKDTENTRIYIVVNQIPLGKEDYIIECVDDKVQYPVFEGELIAYVSEGERKLQEMFDEKHEEKPLTPRQQWLRRLLDSTYDEDDEKALPLKAIYELYETDLLRGDNVVYPNWDYENEHNSSALRAIRDDFMKVATHWSTQAVYTSSNRGLKRANDKEALPILMREYMFAKMRFSRVNNKLDRIDKDGQMRIKLTEHQGDTYDPYKTYRK